MNKMRFTLTEISRSVVLGLVALVVVYGLLFFSLGQLTPSLSQAELEAAKTSQTLRGIIDNPLFAPHKVLQYGAQRLGLTAPAFLRMASATFGLVAVGSFYFLIRRWHTMRIAVLSALLFTTSSWFLFSARYATPDILYLMPLILLSYGVWRQSTRQFELSVCIGAGLLVVSLFIPGMVWLLPPLLLWQRKRLGHHLHQVNRWWQALALLIVVSGLGILLQAFVRQPSLITPWLGLPAAFPGASEYLQNVLRVPLDIFIRSTLDPAQSLGRLPMLDIFASVMFLVGLYAYRFRLGLDRTKLLILVFVITPFLIALKGPVSDLILMPFIYVIVAAGITLMLQQWFTVFPRNPFARSVGASLLTIAVLVSCFFHINQYFIAWPNAPETRATFDQQL